MTSETPLLTNVLDTSESEEMFLITVARAIEDGNDAPIPLPDVAEALSVSRVAANEMAKKLVARGLADYEPYHGVSLTSRGTTIANSVLRRRRLWAFFLAERLGLSPAEADRVACEFEHVTPADVETRLADFLGEPTVDPEGKPIPQAEMSRIVRREESVGDLDVGERAAVVRVAGDQAARSFLKDQGIVENLALLVTAVGSDGSRLLESDRGAVHLAAPLAREVFVRRTG